MQHMTKAATVTQIDQGLFSAVVSTYDIDRQGDQVARGAFGRTISDWKNARRMVPLHWSHSPEPEDIIGYVDPASMKESKAGLTVQGKVDLETERGREAWRLLKANSVGFSFGFLATKTHERGDGIRILDEIDIFEVTITPSPANNRTRVLDLKSYDTTRAQARRWSCPSELIGTAWDPMMATGETKGFTRAEIDTELKLHRKAVMRAKPIKVKTFRV